MHTGVHGPCGCVGMGWKLGEDGDTMRRNTGDFAGGPGASLIAQLVKNPPATWETWVRFLGWEDPLEKGQAPTPVFWPEEFHGLYKSTGLQRVGHD